MAQRVEYLNRIAGLLTEKNMSYSELANVLGCSRNTITNYFTGKTSMPVEHLLKISEHFKIPLIELLQLDQSTLVNQLKARIEDKEKIIEKLEKQLKYLQDFYDRFSESVYEQIKPK